MKTTASLQKPVEFAYNTKQERTFYSENRENEMATVRMARARARYTSSKFCGDNEFD
jgi:hypothetical protein